MARSPKEMRKALGANQPVPVRTKADGPFGVLQLQAELAERLLIRARVGRPSDPAWTIRCLVGFRSETWRTLSEIAALAGVQVVATVVDRQHLGRVARIAQRCFEVDDGIERPALSDPAVDGLAFGFPLRRVKAGVEDLVLERKGMLPKILTLGSK